MLPSSTRAPFLEKLKSIFIYLAKCKIVSVKINNNNFGILEFVEILGPQ